MELKQLEYFMVACEKGSFNQAAECLYTSQPNVSKVIGMLEQELGRALFERTSRGLRVTPYRWQKIRRNGNLPFLPTRAT